MEGARAAVESWQRDLEMVYSGARPEAARSPVLLAWSDLLSRHKIDQELPLDLMRGVLMDTHIARYETWDDLRVYCYRVASTVGLMTPEARFAVLLAARLYARILERIESNGFDVFTRRAHLTLAGKIRHAPRIWREARAL